MAWSPDLLAGGPIGTVTRWAPRHGLAKVAVARAARRGDLRAAMFSDPEASAEPFERYERIRERGRLIPGGLMWTTVDHELGSVVLRGDDFGSPVDPARLPRPLRRMVTLLPDELVRGPVDPPSMLVVNPPVHTRYRRLVSRVFTPRAVEALRDRAEELTARLLDDLERLSRAGGPVDLVEHLASPLPVTIIAEILGVPLDRRAELLRWAAGVAPSLDLGLSYREFADVERNLRSFNRYMQGHLQRLADDPGGDILSQLVAMVGERLEPAELLAIAGLLLGAGFETTLNLIGNGIVLLCRHPDQLAVLRADPQLWPNAVEEILRFDSPVQNTARTAARDTTLGGTALRAGTTVSVLLGAANRDPRRFTDPARFDVRRPNARDHLAFSAGIHFCLGASLARMEAQIALQQLFERFDPTLVEVPRRRTTRTLHGYRSVLVRLRARG